MTVSLVTRIDWYVGLAADDKPATALVGSRFFELDTPSWWIFDGTDWHEQP
jgi:hypothetical protein